MRSKNKYEAEIYLAKREKATWEITAHLVYWTLKQMRKSFEAKIVHQHFLIFGGFSLPSNSLLLISYHNVDAKDENRQKIVFLVRQTV